MESPSFGWSEDPENLGGCTLTPISSLFEAEVKHRAVQFGRFDPDTVHDHARDPEAGGKRDLPGRRSISADIPAQDEVTQVPQSDKRGHGAGGEAGPEPDSEAGALRKAMDQDVVIEPI